MSWRHRKKYKIVSVGKWLISFRFVLLLFLSPVKIEYNIFLHNNFKGMFSDHKIGKNNVISLLFLAKNMA